MYKRAEKSTSQNFSSEPAKNQFQPRPFAAPAQLDVSASEARKPELQSDDKKLQRSGYNLAGILMASGSNNPPNIQPKLTIGAVGDQYEQEADRVASRVVSQVNAPLQKKLQRKSPDAIAATPQPEASKPFIRPFKVLSQEEVAQRQEAIAAQQPLPFYRKLQRRLQNQTVQRQEAIAGGAASADLESSIQSARGGGQSLGANLQQSMGQAMGADFSGVKVHTDSQSDQLNQSIQAKAFTTGQDVFFRQGAYEPSSRSGQELIAHELTHVVQQNGGAVQRSPSLQRDGEVESEKPEMMPIEINLIDVLGFGGAKDKVKDVQNRVDKGRTLEVGGTIENVPNRFFGIAQGEYLLKKDFELPILPGFLNVTGGISINANAQGAAKGKITRELDGWTIDGSIHGKGSLDAGLSLGASVGSSLIFALEAALTGRIHANIDAGLEVKGKIFDDPSKNDLKKLIPQYHLKGELIAGLGGKLKMSYLYFFERELEKVSIGQWNLGLAKIEADANGNSTITRQAPPAPEESKKILDNTIDGVFAAQPEKYKYYYKGVEKPIPAIDPSSCKGGYGSAIEILDKDFTTQYKIYDGLRYKTSRTEFQGGFFTKSLATKLNDTMTPLSTKQYNLKMSWNNASEALKQLNKCRNDPQGLMAVGKSDLADHMQICQTYSEDLDKELKSAEKRLKELEEETA
jgi:hypothetical protein